MRTALQVFSEGGGVVVEGVAGGKEQGHGAFSLPTVEQRDGVALMLQFRPVAPAEPPPLRRIVREPLPQLGARRDVLEPQVDGGGRLLDAARPHAIDQHAKSVLCCCRFVDAFDADQSPTGRASVGQGWYW